MLITNEFLVSVLLKINKCMLIIKLSCIACSITETCRSVYKNHLEKYETHFTFTSVLETK